MARYFHGEGAPLPNWKSFNLKRWAATMPGTLTTSGMCWLVYQSLYSFSFPATGLVKTRNVCFAMVVLLGGQGHLDMRGFSIRLMTTNKTCRNPQTNPRI